MTVNWYRPSQCILISVALSSFLVCFGCLACGYLLHFAPEEPSKDINGGQYTFIPAIGLVVVAGLALIALVLGCCGIIKDSRIVLTIFAVLAIIIALLLLGASSAVFTFTLDKQIQADMNDSMTRQLLSYTEGGDGHEKNMFSHIQKDFKCCGVESYEDWKEKDTVWKRNNTDTLAPTSCCCVNKSDSLCAKFEANLCTQGCLSVFHKRMEYTIFPLFGFCIALSLVEIAVALLAVYGVVIIKRYEQYDVL